MTDPSHISHHLEELLAGYTDEQVSVYLACRRAAGPPPLMEYEKRQRTPEERAYQFAQWGRSIGADDAMIGVELTRVLLRRGYSEEDVAELLRDIGITWKRRTPEERLVHVAGEMLAAGWKESQVRWAVNELVT
jgi:hypothetical protein